MESRGDGVRSARLIDVDDVAEMLGVSRKTVYAWVSERTIPHVKIGRSVLRFRPPDIEAWVESRAVAVGANANWESEGNATK